MRVMMMIKGDREPGHLPSEEFLAQMGKYNEELSKAGVLLDLAALHWERRGRSGQVLRRQAHRDRGPFRQDRGDRRRLLDPPGEIDGGGHRMGQAAAV